VVEVCNAEEALAEFYARTVLAVIPDVEMPGSMNGYDLAWRVGELQPANPSSSSPVASCPKDQSCHRRNGFWESRSRPKLSSPNFVTPSMQAGTLDV